MTLSNLVYGLVDPRTRLVRYIGKSTTGMKRPSQHRRPKPSNVTWCANWVRSLHDVGAQPEIIVLDEFEDAEALNRAERWWIAFGRACAWPLTNLTDGGDGTSGYTKSEATRSKISQSLRGHHVSESTKAKQRAAKLTPAEQLRLRNNNPARTVEARAKISASKRHPEVRAATAARMSGRHVSAETRLKLSISMQERRRRHGSK